MKIIEQKTPFLVFDAPAHNEIKPLAIEAIASMGKFSYINEHQCISNTDWHLSSDFGRPYYAFVAPVFAYVTSQINSFFGYTEPLNVINYWFQWYEKGDHHRLHTHHSTMLNAVYFLSLPDKASKTTFKLHDKEFSVDVKEGQVLVFPSMYMHYSKPNMSDAAKVVIAFNL